MAYQLEYWQDDGKGHSLIRAARLQKFSEEFKSVIFADGSVKSFAEASHPAERPPGCTMITVRRTDHQSPWEKRIWSK
jgi:hypothetical protein